jgi:hypothetical protein
MNTKMMVRFMVIVLYLLYSIMANTTGFSLELFNDITKFEQDYLLNE